MREQLNNNPLAQLAVLGVLLLAGAFFAISTMGGGKEESEPTGGVSATVNGVPGSGATPGEAVEDAVESLESGAGAPAPAAAAPLATAKPVPASVYEAWRDGATVVLLFVRDGGIDDGLVEQTTENLASFPDVVRFVVPAREISRYGAITESLGVERVPALVVISPRRLKEPVPTASVHYGFQSADSVAQAVIDAGYEGRTLDYHP